MVRRDLPLGTLAAQVTHAAGESASLLGGSLPANTHAVVLAAAGEPELQAIAGQLRDAGIPFIDVCEPDPPWNGALMALGILPAADRSPIRKVLSRLPLLR